jgi:hypothetical protein
MTTRPTTVDDSPTTVVEPELFALGVASARCGVKSNDLNGTEPTRTCSRCAQRLHRVASLSVDDVIALRRGAHGRAKLFLRHDGTVAVRDCPGWKRAASVPAPKRGPPSVPVGLAVSVCCLIRLVTVYGDHFRRLFVATTPSLSRNRPSHGRGLALVRSFIPVAFGR